ncbi:MAG: HNH endonuclease [Symploca sp. SIO2C1]|nr:HNH endonuclease [Symploca sp. SIO2C1]
MSQIVNRIGKAYPSVVDPRTMQLIPFPKGNLVKIPRSKRVSWGLKERGQYIAQWYRQGYPDPPEGWKEYDIHHIKPREFGGSNEFENLVPVLRKVHQEQFNAFWRDW